MSRKSAALVLLWSGLIWLGCPLRAQSMEDASVDSLLASGDALIAEQEYLPAQPFFEQALAQLVPDQSPRQAFHAMFWLGEIYYVAGAYQEALRISQRADSLVLERYLPDSLSDYPQLLVNMGVFCSQMGKLDSSLHYYQRSYESALRNFGRESEQVANAFFSLGAAHKHLGQIKKCIALTDTSAQISRRIGYEGGMATAYNNLAFIYAELNDFSKAIAYQRRAMQHVDNRIDRGVFLNNLGSYAIEIGDYPAAIRALEESLEIRLDLYPPGHPFTGSTLLNLASAYFEQGDLDQALAMVRRFEPLYNPAIPGSRYIMQLVYIHEGSILIRRGQLTEGEAQARKALQIDEPEGIPSSYYVLANALAGQKRYAEALQAIQRGITAEVPEFTPASLTDHPPVAQITAFPVLIDLLTTKTRILNQLGARDRDPEQYLLAFQTAQYLDALVSRARLYQKDYVSREFLAADLNDFYAEALESCYQLYQQTGEMRFLEQGYYYSGKNKALQISERLSSQPLDSLRGVVPELVAQDRRLRSEIDFIANKLRYREFFPADQVREWDDRLIHLQRLREGVFARLENQSPGYFELVHRNSVATIKEVQSDLLRPGETLLEYFTTTAGPFFLFVVTPDRVDFLRLPGPPDLPNQIGPFRRSILEQDEAFYDFAEQFYQYFVEPVSDRLPESEQLVIIPDGALSLLPFELFVRPQDSRRGQPGYLLYRHSFRYLFSSRQGIESRRIDPKDRNGQVLALAPAFDRSLIMPRTARAADSVFLPALAGNQQEIRHLRLKYAGQFLSGRRAAKSSLSQADGYSVLHIATHALVDDQFPAFSRLLLHDNRTGDYAPLYAYELLEKQIETELVVLSACNTGFGQIKKGQGVASLARAFAYAGSADLLMSLWPVRDETTPYMMQAFYENLEAGMSKPRALRAAKLKFLQDYRGTFAHPYYWATFVYTGDDQMVYLEEKSAHFGGIPWWGWLILGAALVAGFVVIRARRS